MPHNVSILKVEPVTYDVRRFTVRKPETPPQMVADLKDHLQALGA